MRRAAALLLVLTSALALAACDRQAGPASPGDRGRLPLAEYDVPEDDVRVVGTARWTLAKECMVRLGFDRLRDLDIDPLPGWPRRPAGTGVVSLVVYASDDFRYGVQDPEQAARYGYQAARVDYERHYREKKWTLPEYLALTGEFVGDDPKSVHGHLVPKRGCLGEADRAIHGTVPQDRKDPVLDLGAESLEQGKRDRAWKKADRAWSACMRRAGHRYATPTDAASDPDRDREELEENLTDPEYDLNQPSAAEKKTATADARCKLRTGYVRTVHAVDVRIQNKLIASNRAKLEDQRRWNRDAARRARDILADRS
jgi:hypothetical protein